METNLSAAPVPKVKSVRSQAIESAMETNLVSTLRTAIKGSPKLPLDLKLAELS
jgi:hypothetical protein